MILRPLRASIEREALSPPERTHREFDIDVLPYIDALFGEIRSLPLLKNLDLASPEAAQRALQELNVVAAQLQCCQRTSSALHTLLEPHAKSSKS